MSTTSEISCRYFRYGQCRFGENCRFSHNPALVADTTTVPSRGGGGSGASATGATPSIKTPLSGTAIKTSWLDAPEFVPKQSSQEPVSSSSTTTINPGAKRKQKPTKTFVRDSAEADPNFRVIDDDDEDGENDEEEDEDTDENDDNIKVINNASYANVCKGDDENVEGATSRHDPDNFCPYLIQVGDVCPDGVECQFIHGDLCDMCGQHCLPPTDEHYRKMHVKLCMAQHEKDMEVSFGIARSKDKTCGICFEIVIEKSSGDKRFGILQNCNHVFCLECIRTWRQNKEKQFNSQIARSCPECRITSDFICPSTYWVGDPKEEKVQLIESYKTALSDKHCKYFKNGDGKCPFGNKCFYKHVDKQNNKVDVGDPKKFTRRWNRNADVEYMSVSKSFTALVLFRVQVPLRQWSPQVHFNHFFRAL